MARKKVTANHISECRDYIVLADGWVAGSRVRKGETILLHPKAARYENVALKEDPEASPKTTKAE